MSVELDRPYFDYSPGLEEGLEEFALSYGGVVAAYTVHVEGSHNGFRYEFTLASGGFFNAIRVIGNLNTVTSLRDRFRIYYNTFSGTFEIKTSSRSRTLLPDYYAPLESMLSQLDDDNGFIDTPLTVG